MEKNELGSYQIDIREIVQLSHAQLPIEEIEEMEIIPQIQIEENGAEIQISGSLFLYGDYKGNQEAGKLDQNDDLPESYEESVQFEPLSADRGPYSPLAKQDRFEYRIPVKITMPRNKVAEVDDVYAYINSFDYELKTPYQVEVVASLMISGFSEEKEEQPEDVETPIEFVHTAGDQWNQDFQEYYTEQLQALQQEFEPISQEQQQKEEQVQQETPAVFHRAEQELAPLPPMPAEQAPEKPIVQEAQEQEIQDSPELKESPESPEALEVPQKVPKQSEPFEKLRPSQESEAEAETDTETETDNETQWDNVVPLPTLPENEREETAEALEEQEEVEEEKDVRVAISNKGTKQDQEPISSLASIFARIPKQEAKKEDEQAERSEHAKPSAEADQEENDALYLTNFMENEAEQFTKVKICIIQKDETIEEIAERYEMTVDAILRANGGAARNQVASGQLLYIPVKG